MLYCNTYYVITTVLLHCFSLYCLMAVQYLFISKILVKYSRRKYFFKLEVCIELLSLKTAECILGK